MVVIRIGENMNIEWVSVDKDLPNIGEKVLTCDKSYPSDGFEWECRIENLYSVEWSSSYSVSHFARLNIDDV